ncbi:MAG: ADP-ribosylglycohydrolase superfamily [Candidatus Peregrinibacteria bacterium GW2011_GWF2_33_10]|nr:MAG: ADP-ribosylglycohydrolase superfamily [Candidatus Peregrinibacteria bacterium GW2011_GWF2_33_10]
MLDRIDHQFRLNNLSDEILNQAPNQALARVIKIFRTQLLATQISSDNTTVEYPVGISKTILINTLLGCAIGDSYGAGLENYAREWIADNIDFTHFVDLRTNHDVQAFRDPKYRVWDYTDDTQMTIGLIKALIKRESSTASIEDLIMQCWLKEYEQDCQSKGDRGHGYILSYFKGNKAIDEIRERQRIKLYPGNAAPMRATPIGFLPEEEINKIATINANLTHPHPKSIAASILIARATRFLVVERGDPRKLIEYCLKYIENTDQETIEMLRQTDELPTPLNLTKNQLQFLTKYRDPSPPTIFIDGQTVPIKFSRGENGLFADAMLTAVSALYILKHSPNTFLGLISAVQLGGDVDSIASIVTAILGGRYGLGSLPEYMRQNVEGQDYLQKIATDFHEYLKSLN